MQAVLAQPDRTKALQSLDVPRLVIHGLSDKLVHVSGGRATARAIPGAELVLIPGMGHDMPRQAVARPRRRVARTAGAPLPRPPSSSRFVRAAAPAHPRAQSDESSS